MIGNSTGGNNKNNATHPLKTERSQENFREFYIHTRVVFFSIILFCIVIKSGSQEWASLSFVPPTPAEVRINCRTVARAKFVFINRGVRQFWALIELGATHSSKTDEDALQFIKMCVRGASAKNCWNIFQKCRGTSHSTAEQGLEQCIGLLKL